MNVRHWLRKIHSLCPGIKASSQVKPLGNQEAAIRVLIIANAMIPTMQLSLLAPLAKLVEDGDCFIDFITEQQLRENFGKELESSKIRKWIEKRYCSITPTHVIFCRYSGPHAETMLDVAQTLNVPSIYCIDDDLLNVPHELGRQKFDYHNHPLRLNTVQYLLNNVDLIYCSNARLEKHLYDSCVNGNLYAGKIFCAGEVISPAELRPVRTIGYMGFDHAHDFEIVLPALTNILRFYPGLRFELFGKIPKPAALDEFGERIVELPTVPSYKEFLKVLAARNWDIGICPLVNTTFNRVKNVNKWIEYTVAGAAVIASSEMIYDECCADGCGLLVGNDDWEAAFMRLIEGPEQRFDQVKKAQLRLLEEYSLDKLRAQLLNVFASAKEIRQSYATVI